MVGRSATGRQPLGCWEGEDGPLIGELGDYCARIMRIELNRFAVNGTATRIFLLSLLSSSLTPW